MTVDEARAKVLSQLVPVLRNAVPELRRETLRVLLRGFELAIGEFDDPNATSQQIRRVLDGHEADILIAVSIAESA